MSHMSLIETKSDWLILVKYNKLAGILKHPITKKSMGRKIILLVPMILDI